MAAATAIELEAPRPAPLGRIEDRRQARLTWLVRMLFLVGLSCWTLLASWWAVYFFRTTVEVRDVTLRAYAAEAQLNAEDMEHLRLSPAQARQALEGTVFTLAQEPVAKGIFPWASLGGSLQGYAVVVRAGEQQRLRTNVHRKFIMLAGEGSVLVGLLFTILVALYRMLVEEVRLRRHQESFVHSVTHELKSPLAGLRAMLQSFQHIELPPEERRTYLQMGLGEIDRLDQLVGNILLSSRLEAQVFKPHRETIDLQTVLTRLRDRKVIRFQEKGGSLRIEVGATQARSDPQALETILENLVDNALKYGGDHPNVVVRARPAGSRVEVDVSDDGVGLSAADQAHVFKKFYRAPSGEVQQAKGSGLGLYIARGLARACGGDLTVQSAGPGKGSTFTLKLST